MVMNLLLLVGPFHLSSLGIGGIGCKSEGAGMHGRGPSGSIDTDEDFGRHSECKEAEGAGDRR